MLTIRKVRTEIVFEKNQEVSPRIAAKIAEIFDVIRVHTLSHASEC